MTNENIMRKIYVEKVTLNVGAGKDQVKLEKAEKLLKHITGIPPVRTKTDKRIAAWGLRPGLPIGCKLTLRGEKALAIIPRLLYAVDMKLRHSCFDDNGNISFGIREYIDIKDTKYDPEIGSMGLQATITLKRPGFRIKNRKVLKRSIPKTHRISKEESINFMKENFGLKTDSEE
ncbi:MAG: 50S ribosomal protein L5 [Candidatus Woesearchaeota archaeon]|nr:MAG: 50S ribosomal protein L5 [Candidatus Woesearchaeota archaeon]